MHSQMIQLNGEIPMVMGMEIMEIGHRAMELNGLTMTVTGSETIQTEPMVINSQMIH